MLTPSERRLSDQADRARARGDHLGADRLRRELFAEQARRYRPGGDPGGPGPSVESQAAHIEGAAHVAPKPLASKLARLKERTRSRRRVVREAGHLESVGVAVTPSGHDPGGIGLQSPPALKLWPTLAQRCLKKRRDRQYRVWVLARSLPGAGRGCVRVAELSELIEREKIGGLSPGTLRRLINSGGTFWKVFYRDGDKWLELRGLGSVCLALGVERLSSAPVLIPTRWAKTLRAFRAACYASGFPTSAMSNPISRRVIEAQIGKTARTQRGYDAALLGKVRKQDNAQHVGNPKHGDEIQRGYYLDKVSLPDGTEEIALFKRLPNSFQVGFERGRRGMMRRVNRQLRYPVRNEGTGKREKKLFYRDAKSVNRRLECNQDDFLYQLKTVMRWPKPVGDGIPRKPKPISITCQTRGGADLWEGVHKVGGLVIR